MSDSPRWYLGGLPGTTGIVEVMLYADHVAALAEAYDKGWDTNVVVSEAVAAAQWENHLKTYDGCMALERAYSEGVKAARDAVAAIEHWTSYTPDDKPWECYASDPLTAIDKVKP